MKNKTTTKELSTDSLEIGSPENESRLPRDWNLARFDEVAYATDYVANGSFASLRENVRYKSEPDYAILVRLTDYTKRWRGDYVYVDKHAYDFLRKSSVEPGDIIIANVGDPGRVFRVPNLGRSMTLGPNSVLVRPKEGLEKAFLQYFFMSSWGQQLIAKITTGTAQKKFNKTSLRALRIPIAPPDQQNRVVAEIEKQFSRLDEAVANLKRVKANLKRYKAAVLKAAVEGKLTEEWREAHPDVEPASELLKRILAERRAKWRGKGKYKEPARANTQQLLRLPDQWTWTTVEQLSSWLPGSIQSGPFGSHLLHSEFVSEGILAIGIDNVREGKFRLGANHRISEDKYSQLKKFAARPRDVLITVMATVGRVCVVPENLEPAIVTKHCYRITPSSSAINSHFLAIALRADSASRRHIFGNLRGQTRPGINGPILKNAPVPLPPVLEQQWVVEEVERQFSVIDEMETQVLANLQRAERFRQSILQRAFAGKLIDTDVHTSDAARNNVSGLIGIPR